MAKKAEITTAYFYIQVDIYTNERYPKTVDNA